MQGADVTENKILFCHTDAGAIFCTTAGFRQEYIYVDEQKNFFFQKALYPFFESTSVLLNNSLMSTYSLCQCKHETPLIREGAATAFVLILHINNLYKI